MKQEQQPVISQYDPEMINRLKEEIINDLKARREWQEKYYSDLAEYNEEYGYPGAYGYPGYGRRAARAGYGRRNAGYGAGRYGPGMGMGPGRYYGWCPYPPPPPYKGRKQPEFDYDWWTDREEYDYQRNMMMLRRQVQNELRAIDKINRRLSQVSDPQVRRLLADLLQEADRQGMDINELMQSLNMQNPGWGTALLDRVTGPFRGIDRRSFGWGAGAALLGLLLLPTLGKSLRPLARKAMEEAMDITERAQSVFAQAKEEFEDIVAEANFNKIKESMVIQSGMNDKEPPAKK
ncbi:hypothetical protein JCM39194_13590 [Desulfotomaculum varum]